MIPFRGIQKEVTKILTVLRGDVFVCVWAGVSKWLSQEHGFGSDEWLMCFMNKMTPRAVKGVAVTFCLPQSGIIRGMFIH